MNRLLTYPTAFPVIRRTIREPDVIQAIDFAADLLRREDLINRRKWREEELSSFVIIQGWFFELYSVNCLFLFRHSLFLFNAPNLVSGEPIQKSACAPDPSGSFLYYVSSIFSIFFSLLSSYARAVLSFIEENI